MHFRHKNDKVNQHITREIGFIVLKQATPCLSVDPPPERSEGGGGIEFTWSSFRHPHKGVSHAVRPSVCLLQCELVPAPWPKLSGYDRTICPYVYLRNQAGPPRFGDEMRDILTYPFPSTARS